MSHPAPKKPDVRHLQSVCHFALLSLLMRGSHMPSVQYAGPPGCDGPRLHVPGPEQQTS